MKNILSVQLSYFCDYHIQSSIESVTTLMDGLNKLGYAELLPSVIPGQKINIVEGKAMSSSNLSFNSPDGSIQIVCMDNRIDCTIRANSTQIELDTDLTKCCNLLEFIISHFKILGNRLAINIDALGTNNISDFKAIKTGRILSSLLPYYNENNINDLSAYLNSRTSINLLGREEIINVITNISTAFNNKDKSTSLFCHVDINTIPENQELRYDYSALNQFISAVKVKIQQILNEFEEMDNE